MIVKYICMRYLSLMIFMLKGTEIKHKNSGSNRGVNSLIVDFLFSGFLTSAMNK